MLIPVDALLRGELYCSDECRDLYQHEDDEELYY